MLVNMKRRRCFHASRNLVRRIGRVVVPMHMRRAAMPVRVSVPRLRCLPMPPHDATHPRRAAKR